MNLKEKYPNIYNDAIKFLQPIFNKSNVSDEEYQVWLFVKQYYYGGQYIQEDIKQVAKIIYKKG